MQDQYGNPVPKDLIVLANDWLGFLTGTEARKIDGLKWYEKRSDKPYRASSPLVSRAELFKALPELVVDCYTLADLGGDFEGEVLYIDHVLHRFNTVDGWYHA